MTGAGDLYAGLHAQLNGNVVVTQQTADSWLGLYTSLNELAAALNSHQVSLLSDSGWSGPAAEQFQAYMTAMTQQVKGAALSAAAISTELQDAAGTLHSAQQAVITAEEQGPPGETYEQRAQRMTPILQEQVQTVTGAYATARQNLTQAQAVAPTPSNPGDGTWIPDATSPYTVSGSVGTHDHNGLGPGSGGYDQTSGIDSGNVVGRSAGGTDTRSTNSSGQPLGGGGVDSASVRPAGLGSYEPGQGPAGGQVPNVGSSPEPSPGAGPSTGWWPGSSGGPDGSRGPESAEGPGSSGSGRPASRGSATSGPAYGDGSEGIHGGVRGPSTLPGQRIGNPAARAIGEVEPGIIGGEPVGGGRVIGNRGTGYGTVGDSGEPGGVGEGISGGRLEASPAQGMRRASWGRSALAPEGEAAGVPAGGMPMGGAGARQEKERGKRPKYLKQDPEYWQAKVDVVPPVIE